MLTAFATTRAVKPSAKRRQKPYVVDTDALVDVFRNNQAAIVCIDRRGDDFEMIDGFAIDIPKY
jgi:hypothetical protein